VVRIFTHVGLGVGCRRAVRTLLSDFEASPIENKGRELVITSVCQEDSPRVMIEISLNLCENGKLGDHKGKSE